jgi:hypothetical protein
MSLYSSMTLSTCLYCEGHGCGHYLVFNLRENHKEDKFLGLGDDLPALLSKVQRNGGRWRYL